MEDRYRIMDSKVECETIEDEVIIIQFDTGNYYTLSGTGAFVWQSFDRRPTQGELLALIAAHYETEAHTQVSEEIGAFLDELVRENLIEWAASEAPNRSSVEWAENRQPYKAPVLERYSDMQALLVLDPIHEVDTQGWPHTAALSD